LGIEGNAARNFFQNFDGMIKVEGSDDAEGGGNGRGLTGGLALGKVVGLDSRHETDAGPGDGEAAEHETDEGNQESATHLAQPNL
jgi:hypothetical protein